MFSGGLHVMDNLGRYADKPIYSCENIIEEQGSMVISKLLKSSKVSFEVSKLLSNSHWVKKWKS